MSVTRKGLRQGAFDSWKGDRLLKREGRKGLGLLLHGEPQTLPNLKLWVPPRDQV